MKAPKLSKRFIALCIDFAMFLGLFYFLCFVVFNHVFTAIPQQQIVTEARIASGLYEKDLNGIYGQLKTNDVGKLEYAVQHFYLEFEDDDKTNYFNSTFYKNNGGLKKAYTFEEYNNRILLCGQSDSFFEYQVIDDKIDRTKLAQIKQKYFKTTDTRDLTNLTDNGLEVLISFYAMEYRNCFIKLFDDKFYSDATKHINDMGKYQFACSITLPAIAIYLLFPLFNKFGKTPGKLIMSIAIITFQNRIPEKRKIALRAIPTLILCLITFFTDDVLILGTFNGGYFLLELTVVLIMQNHYSLPDYISSTKSLDLVELRNSASTGELGLR